MNVFQTLQFFPLTVFLVTSRVTGDWPLGFKVSGILALAESLWLLWRKIPFDRFLAAINLFLLVGAIAFGLPIISLQMQYGELRETALFIALLCVGMGTAFVSPRGFINVDSGVERKKTILASLALILCTGVASWFSSVYRGNILISAALPFIMLGFIRNGLARFVTRYSIGKEQLMAATAHKKN